MSSLAGDFTSSRVLFDIKFSSPCFDVTGGYPVTVKSCGNTIEMSIKYFTGHFRNLNWRYLPYIRPIFQAYFFADIPRKYALKYGTNVPPF